MDVVIVGSIVVDLISYVERFPSIGETVFGYKFKKGFGGKGANQCVMAKLLGAKSSIVGKVGDDSFGKEYIQRFDELSIETNQINVSLTASTGVATIVVQKEGGANQIVVSPGANFEVSLEDIKNANRIISQSKVIVCQLEIPIQSTYYALTVAKQHGVTTIFNPAPIPDNGLDMFEMPVVDVFCPNESEASLITNISIKNVQDAIKAIEYFFLNFSEKIRYPMITLGHQGVVYGDSKTTEIIHEPAPMVNVVDSTGAGDCFIGSLAFYFSKHPEFSLNEKVKRSIYLASLSVQHEGTQSSFPNLRNT